MPTNTFVILVLSSLCWLEGVAQMIHVQGEPMYINGINIPWRNFGRDFGGYGRDRYDTAYYERTFQELQLHGVNTVRMWIHCDGRHSPRATAEGEIVELPGTFLDDLEDFLKRAERYHLMVIPVLWSFEMVERRGLRNLITDPDKTKSYIERALIPMLDRTGHFCNVLAWEVINEPEWSMDIPFAGTLDNKVPASDMQRFVAMIADAVHHNSDHAVTVGCAGLRFLTDMYTLSENYWHDMDLRRSAPECQGAYLDFYTVHYYKWKMEPLSPFRQDLRKMGLEKPVVLTEFGLSSKEGPEKLMRQAMDNGYAGVMPWSMSAGDGHGSWLDYREPLQNMAKTYAHMMSDLPVCLHEEIEHYYTSCHVYPNPAADILYLSPDDRIHQPIRVEVYSTRGERLIQQSGWSDERMALSVDGLHQGLYVLRVFARSPDGVMRESSQQKIAIVR